MATAKTSEINIVENQKTLEAIEQTKANIKQLNQKLADLQGDYDKNIIIFLDLPEVKTLISTVKNTLNKITKSPRKIQIEREIEVQIYNFSEIQVSASDYSLMEDIFKEEDKVKKEIKDILKVVEPELRNLCSKFSLNFDTVTELFFNEVYN